MAKQKKILLIEDDHAQIEMYKLRLEVEGYDMAVIENADDGIAGDAKKIKPDLILLDLVLKNADGVEILRLLKEDADTKNINVIVLTNLSKNTKLKEAEKLGAVDVIIKAKLTLDQLMARIKKQM